MAQVLSSWKEIAEFFGKGVRTVQRWEKELALPVQRPSVDRAVVLAKTEELTAWMTRNMQPYDPEVPVVVSLGDELRLNARVQELKQQGFVVVACESERQARYLLRILPKVHVLAIAAEQLGSADLVRAFRAVHPSLLVLRAESVEPALRDPVSSHAAAFVADRTATG